MDKPDPFMRFWKAFQLFLMSSSTARSSILKEAFGFMGVAVAAGFVEGVAVLVGAADADLGRDLAVTSVTIFLSFVSASCEEFDV